MGFVIYLAQHKDKSIYFHNLLSHSGLTGAVAYNMKIIGLYLGLVTPTLKHSQKYAVHVALLASSEKNGQTINSTFQLYW